MVSIRAVSVYCMIPGLLAFSSGIAAETVPSCGDKAILEKIQLQFRAIESASKIQAKIDKFSDIRETALGPPPASANQYASSENFIAETRYCEAGIMVTGGVADTAYWVIHHFKESGQDSFLPDICSLKFDTWEDGCAHLRPVGTAPAGNAGMEACDKFLGVYETCANSSTGTEQATLKKGFSFMQKYIKGKAALPNATAELGAECEKLLQDLKSNPAFSGCKF